jgi:hypothetical protein
MVTKRIASLVLLVLLFSALSVLDTAAKGVFGFIDFQIPGMSHSFRLEKPDIPVDLNMGQFENFPAVVESPDNLGAGLLINRGWYTEEGEAEVWDQLLYFSNLEGDLGYMYYLGLTNGSSAYDGRWFQVTGAGQAALMKLLNDREVHLQGLNSSDNTLGQSTAERAITRELTSNQIFTPVGAVVVLASLAGLLWINRTKPGQAQ